MRKTTFRGAIRAALDFTLSEDKKAFLIGEDIGAYGGAFKVTEGLYEKYGSERVIDTPVSENAIVGGAVGAAVSGMRPIAEIMFSDFLTVCADQLINQAAKLSYMSGGQTSVPLVVRAPSGTGGNAASQQSQSLEGLFAGVAGLKVVMPSDAYTAYGLLRAAVKDDNPVLFLEPKSLYGDEGEIEDGDYTLAIDKARVAIAGSDVSVITYGAMTKCAFRAARTLKNRGISVGVLDLVSLSPLDRGAIIDFAKKTGRVVIAHEANKSFGIGAEVAATICESEALCSLKKPILRVCGLDTPIPFARELEAESRPNEEKLISAIEEIMK